jgi:aromatic ring hydroxylase
VALPSRAALADPALRPLIDQYLAGVGVDAEQRSRLFRLGWDFAGTALASRNEQYERFYLGSVGRNLTYTQMLDDRTSAKRLVDRLLNEELDPLRQREARRGQAPWQRRNQEGSSEVL